MGFKKIHTGIIVANETNFWANTQDLYHKNIIDGFDLMTDFEAITKYGTYASLSLAGDFNITVRAIVKDLSNGYILGGANYIRVNTATQLRVKFGAIITSVDLDLTLVVGGYYSFRIVRIGSTVTIYIDGILQANTMTNAGVFTTTIIGNETAGVGNGVGFIKSIEISGLHRWTAKGGWLDEIGSKDATLSGSPETVKVPDIQQGNLTNQSGDWHNNAETKWLPNAGDEAELISRAGLSSSDERHSSDTINRPEFINANDEVRVKDYLVYDSNISADQGDKVDISLGNTPSEFSSQALAAFAVYDSIGDGLTESQKTALAVHIDTMVANGNYALMLSEAIDSFSGNNARVDYIAGTIALQPVPPSHSLDGHAFNGSTQYLNWQFQPLSHGITQNDVYVAVFVKTFNNASTGYFFGAADGSSSIRLRHSSIGNLQHSTNASGVSSEAYALGDNTLLGMKRAESGKMKIYADGVEVANSNIASVAPTDQPFYSGCQNFNGSAATFMEFTESARVIAKDVGFDHVAHYNSLKTLLTTLGLTGL